MKLRKILATFAASMLLVLSLCALAGCADNSKQVITDGLNAELNLLKNPDEATLTEFTADVPAEAFDQLGLTPNEVVAAMLEGFDGTVDNVVVNGNTAEATLTLSSKNFSEITPAMAELSRDIMANPTQFAGMSADEINAAVGQMLMERIQNLPVVQHQPITVTYERNGGTWEPASDVATAIAANLLTD